MTRHDDGLLAAECRRMADMLPGAPNVAALLRRAADGLETVQVEAEQVVHRAMFDRGAESMRKKLHELVGCVPIRLSEMEGRP